ncbi:MAG TPA: hypothetical protein V6D17_16580 [Candidatus Obscuribacterales bacterium]
MLAQGIASFTISHRAGKLDTHTVLILTVFSNSNSLFESSVGAGLNLARVNVNDVKPHHIQAHLVSALSLRALKAYKEMTTSTTPIAFGAFILRIDSPDLKPYEFVSSKGTVYKVNPHAVITTEDGEKIWGAGLRPRTYRDSKGKEYLIAPYCSVRTDEDDLVYWDGRGTDKHGRSFYLRNDGSRDYDVKCTAQPQPNWMGNRRPNFTTDPRLRRGRYQGSDVAVYSTIFGDAIDWIETRRGNFGSR